MMDDKILHGLHPLCHLCTRPGDRSAILLMMMFLCPRTETTSPSTPLWRQRSMSPSAIESLLTLVSTMWTYLRGFIWTKSFPPSFRPTTLTVTPSLASELEPLPLPGTSTGTLLWSGTSVMGLTRLSAWWKGSDDLSNEWMTLQPCK
jgi:hypothetical protein